jgi:hypothetical protein
MGDARSAEHGIKAALKERKFSAQIIWGRDDRTLRMKKCAPHLLKAPDLEGYEVISGKHFLQEDSSRAIASLIARSARRVVLRNRCEIPHCELLQRTS